MPLLETLSGFMYAGGELLQHRLFWLIVALISVIGAAAVVVWIL